MNLPNDPVSWLVLLLKILVGLVPVGTVLYILLSRIAAHSICLSGQRTSEDSADVATYRFALQNNEEAPLTGRQKLKVKILDANGEFVEPSPAVYAGCTKFERSPDVPNKEWFMVFDELPAYDTWAVECTMNRHSRNIHLTIEEEGSSSTPPTRLSKKELLLTADQQSVFVGRRKTPEAWWAWFVTAMALIAYCAWFEFKLTQLDLWFAAVVVVFSGVLFLLTRRDAPAITQGYVKPSVGDGSVAPRKTPVAYR